ncbi:hypothetical protein VTO42DRAFT_7646 [Malbranchea cinnamomea]
MNPVGSGLPKAAGMLVSTSRCCANQCRTVGHQVQSRTFYNIGRVSRERRPYNQSTKERIPSSSKRQFHATSAKAAQRDPYEVLGVGRNATASEIKRAYYGLAKKYHPDTNKDPGAKEKFAEAQSAYELLSDPEKRQAYDRYGASAFDQNGGFHPGAAGAGPFGAGAGGFHGFSGSGGFGGGFGADINIDDILGAFTGQSSRRSRRGPFQASVLVGEDIEVQTTVSFMEAAKGTTKSIFITPMVPCGGCGGNGMKKGQKRTQCSTCGGSGTVSFVQGPFHLSSTCGACGGAGTSIPRGSECSSCNGSGVVRERRTIDIDIPAGVEDGMRLRIAGEGDTPPADSGARTQRGDLYVSIKVAPDRRFNRSGSDILYTATIPFTTAILGGEVTVPTLEGDVKVKVATGTNTGDRITLPGKGLKKLGSRRGYGDLRVEYKVALPKSLTANQRTILEVLADEMGDATAKRIMNIGQDRSSTGTSQDGKPKSSSDDSQKSEGFLKSAWHRLTSKHRNQNAEDKNQSSSSSKDSNHNDSKKDASGSS